MSDDWKKCTRYSEGGFTIIEILVAMMLLVMAMVPLASALTISLRTTVTTNTRMLARQIGATEIDRARSMMFGEVGINGVLKTFASPGPTPPAQSFQIGPDAGLTGFNAGPETVTAIGGGVDFKVTRDVEKIASRRYETENWSYTKKVVIKVSWDAPQPAGSDEFTTIIGPSEMTN
ncbi:MAG: type IV pilus modification PilV family protein [Thermoleophilia bacterium]